MDSKNACEKSLSEEFPYPRKINSACKEKRKAVVSLSVVLRDNSPEADPEDLAKKFSSLKYPAKQKFMALTGLDVKNTSVVDHLRMEKRILEQQLEKIKKEEVMSTKKKKVTPVTKTIIRTDFPCNECDPIRYYDNAKALRNHKDYTHGICFQCRVDGCNERFGRSFKLKNHMNIDHGMADPYICKNNGCGEQFATQSAQEYHYIHHHSSKFECSKCRQKFISQIRLDSHNEMDSCYDTEPVKTAKRNVKVADASASGTTKEDDILAWFDLKHKVRLKRVGGVSKHKELSRGKIVSGCCDGIDPQGKYCVEAKVVTTKYRLTQLFEKKSMLLKSGSELKELLRAMFVYEVKTGHIVFFYTPEPKYYEFEIRWEDYENYFWEIYS